MNSIRSIALVSPHARPAQDEITWRIAHEADALARRGHRVSILTPARGAALLDDGRRRLHALRGGDTAAVRAEPGEVLVVPLGRALPAGPRRRIGGPLDLAGSLEDVLSRVPFDVVHVHEPLAPSPALAALRHARGATAATFYRPEQLAGVAFVQPLLERAVGRIDVWTATSDGARRAVREMFVRDCEVIPAGVDPQIFHPRDGSGVGPPGVVIVARGTDRVGLRFAFRVLRGLPAEDIGPVTVLGPSAAPWRTRAAIPKAFRDRTVVVADTGTDARATAFASGGIALIAAPEDLAGSAASEAMACGMILLVPRSAEADALVSHGREGIALTAFSRDVWAAAVVDLVRDPARRAELGATAAARASLRSWDDVAAELEGLYATAGARMDGDGVAGGRIMADLRVHPGPSLTPREIVDACLARSVGAVAVISDGTVEPGHEAARLARERLTVITGQRVRSSDGVLVGLFLSQAVPDGLTLEETAARIHAQGGVTMAPHPRLPETPSQDLLRRHRSAIDCFEAVSGPSATARPSAGADAARLAQRLGLLVSAGSGAITAEEVGGAHLRMRPFGSPREFLEALADAEPVQRRRGLRVRSARERRRSDVPVQ